MPQDLRRIILAGIFGLLYGTFLIALGLLAAGFGHGTYVVIGLVSAPCGLTQNARLAILGGPLFWSACAAAAAGARRWAWRTTFLLVMCAHYVSLPWVLGGPSGFSDWQCVPRVKDTFWQAIALYALGQAALWCLAIYQTWKSFARRG
jgi:hypothetical protein